MKKKNINLFILGAVILTLALFGCNSGKTANNTTAAGALIDGAALYTSDCSGCHGSLATSGKRKASVAQIQDAIAHNWGGMGAFASLTADQLQAIATALSAPVTLTGDTTSSTNGPDTSASSTASLDGAVLYSTNCQGCHNPLATTTKAGRTAAQIQAAITGNYGGMNQFSSLTPAQIQAIADALATVRSLTLTPSPASGTSSNSLDGAALYAQYCQGCHQPLASSVKKGRTAAQITAAIGSVGQMSYLSTLTQTQINAIASALAPASGSSGGTSGGTTTTDGATLYAQYCQGCHGSLAASTKAGRTATQITAAIGSVGQMSYLSTLTQTQINAIASALAPAPGSSGGTSGGTTTTDGATLYTQYCQGCHGSLATSAKAGRTAAQITAAIGSVGQMSSLSTLTQTQINAIASALATAPAPAPTDGAGLYTSYCSSCHGALANSSVRGSSASTISSALSSVSQMRSTSLTSTQINAIASALGSSASGSSGGTSGGTTTTDGAALYTSYCSSCHGSLAASAKAGRTAAQITAAISSVGQMSSLSILTSTQIQAIASALAAAPAPAPTDGAALYTSYCSSCHGALANSSVRGSSASTISSALSSVSQMRSISLTSTQISAIASALGSSASGSSGGTSGGTTTSTDGAALYTQYCQGCHGSLASSSKAGRTATQITAAIGSVSQMSSLSSLTSAQIQAIATALSSSGTTGTTPPPTTMVCGSCHAIPPATGHHSLHVNSEGLSCSTCHGTGYSKTTVNAATHNNGVVNIASGIPPGWNPTTRTCSNSCHGTHSW